MLSRIIQVPEQSFILLGSRGSGKSTWLRAAFPDARVIELLSEETYQRLLANPGQFAENCVRLQPVAWCKGQRAIETLEGLQRRIVVYPCGPAMRTADGIGVLPFKEFADELAAGALWG